MIVGNAFELTLKQIGRNPMRTALTTLGILIGVAAVIAMIALGRGAAARVSRDLSGLGQNLLFVLPGTPGHGGGPGARTSAPPFAPEDVTALRREVRGLAGVAPLVARSAVAVYGAASWRTQVNGTTHDYFSVLSWQLAAGRSFGQAEERLGAAVCLLGATVRRELFGSVDPLGAAIRVEGVSLRVIGTLRPKGQSTFGQDQDDFVVIPLATQQRRFTGQRDVDAIFLSAVAGADTDRIKADIDTLMRQRRHLRPGDIPDFFLRDMKEIAATVGSVTSVLTSLLAAIAAVSLLVGGIGIMNIMLVSVSERTREIGIRMAIGARSRDVLAQFLIESITLSAIGGIAGIAIGLGGSYLATQRLGLPLTIDLPLLALPFGFAAAVGVIFGFFPARKAARLDPIEALRHE
jgi:putative ABC transport system permease protein